VDKPAFTDDEGDGSSSKETAPASLMLREPTITPKPCALTSWYLTLRGNGFQLSSLTESTVQFDLDANDFAEQTGWVKPADALRG